MALIACPDCGREVSTSAPACVHCGRPVGSAPAAPASSALAFAATAPVPGSEETLWRGTPSWMLLAGHLAGLLVVAIVLPLLVHVLLAWGTDLPALQDHAGAITKWSWIIIGLLLLYRLVVFIVAISRLRSTIYTVTNQRIIVERGVFAKAVEDIDLRYVDDTQLYQGFFDRMLKIGNVTVVSSDKKLPQLLMAGISDPRGLRELIRTHAYQVSQRQFFTRAT